MSASFCLTGTSLHVHCPSLFALLCIIGLFLLPLSHLLGCTITTLSTYIHSHTTSQHYYPIRLRNSWQPGTHYHANTDTCSLSACLCSRFWTRMEIHRPGYFSTLRPLRHPDPLFSPFLAYLEHTDLRRSLFDSLPILSLHRTLLLVCSTSTSDISSLLAYLCTSIRNTAIILSLSPSHFHYYPCYLFIRPTPTDNRAFSLSSLLGLTGNSPEPPLFHPSRRLCS